MMRLLFVLPPARGNNDWGYPDETRHEVLWTSMNFLLMPVLATSPSP